MSKYGRPLEGVGEMLMKLGESRRQQKGGSLDQLSKLMTILKTKQDMELQGQPLPEGYDRAGGKVFQRKPVGNEEMVMLQTMLDQEPRGEGIPGTGIGRWDWWKKKGYTPEQVAQQDYAKRRMASRQSFGRPVMNAPQPYQPQIEMGGTGAQYLNQAQQGQQNAGFGVQGVPAWVPPFFDYASAKQQGFTDDQIRQYLAETQGQ